MATLFGFTAALQADSPNIILILTDDQGLESAVGLNGSRKSRNRLQLPSHSGDGSDSGRGNAFYRWLFTRAALHPDPAQHPLRDECGSLWNGIRQ